MKLKDIKKNKKKKSQQWLPENKWSTLLKHSNNNLLELLFTSLSFYYSGSCKSFCAYADDYNFSKSKMGQGEVHENVHFID